MTFSIKLYFDMLNYFEFGTDGRGDSHCAVETHSIYQSMSLTLSTTPSRPQHSTEWIAYFDGFLIYIFSLSLSLFFIFIIRYNVQYFWEFLFIAFDFNLRQCNPCWKIVRLIENISFRTIWLCMYSIVNLLSTKRVQWANPF